ncbi:MAG: LytTR family DNA-binding domain-containing protein [Tenuifilaceae bacterium]|nr:LytTR family DNA-binding domain-containing protein [Tenuifilaceae bacterium]
MILSFNQKNKKIVLNEKGKMHFINLEQISYICSNDYLLTIHLVNNTDRITITGKLGEFEVKLKELGFAKINRSCIVNLTAINTYNLIHQKIVIENVELKVSRNCAKQLREHLSVRKQTTIHQAKVSINELIVL